MYMLKERNIENGHMSQGDGRGANIVLAGAILSIVCDLLYSVSSVTLVWSAFTTGDDGPVTVPRNAALALGGFFCLCMIGCVIMAAMAIKQRGKGKAAVLGGVLLAFHIVPLLLLTTRWMPAVGCLGPILILIGGNLNTRKNIM